ncbi:MAG: hypothetical protein A3G34_01295 [Candidatus Lindowbacteria bacterium RIFCSPLOWO2_12_FULL_62_27]|nr:MAG: hypothetical protein A3G34_01295 [Candidatus Lindowbacteria bacterium RIFCSPLOWO2_12_FULL_62_27]OGH63705.1 MAG: hypothetical protein A3I06_07750 [Candidatus Lindowbacteria bacterium RIFCSPLOWO2_02_FULL_62_12]
MTEPEAGEFDINELDQLKKDIDGLEASLTGARTASSGVVTEGPSASVEQVLGDFYRFGLVSLRQKLLFFEMPFNEFKKSFSVFPGQTILAPTQRVKNVTVKSFEGRHLVLDEESFRLFAKINGFVRWINNRLTVDPVREIPRSVDGSTGAVECDGTAVIVGNVGKGGKVKATGDIYVLADVDGGSISAGGSIFIYNGVLRRSTLFAEGSIFCNFIERAEAVTKRDLWVKTAVTHSRITCHGKMVVFDAKQHGFLSGSATVGRELNAAQIGVEGQRVDVAVKFESYQERLQDFKTWLNEMLGLSKESQEKKVADLFVIEAQPVAEFLQKESETPSLGRVAFSRKMSKGVKVTIGGVTVDTTREEGAGTWKLDAGKLKKDPYEAPEYTESITRLYWRSVPEAPPAADLLAKMRRNVVLSKRDAGKIGLLRALLGRPPGDNVLLVASNKTLDERPQEQERVILKEAGDEDEKLKTFFDMNPAARKVKVTCDEIKKGLEAASSKLDIPIIELAFDVIQEKSEGVMGLNKRPYILEIYRKPIIREDLGKPTLPMMRATAAGGMAAAIKKSEGYYTIENTPDGLYLTVYPAEGENAKGVDVRVLLADLKARGYTNNVSEAVVRTVTEESRGERVRLADRQPEAKLDGKCEINVSADKLKAVLSVTPPKEGGMPVVLEDVLRKVAEMGIQNVDQETVAAYLEGGAFHDSLLISEGTPSVDGEDARLEFLFKGGEGEREELKEDDSGRVDYRTMSSIKGVKEGQLLIKKYAPTEGTVGVDVYGSESRPKAGKDVALQAGKNVQVSPDGTEFFAVTSGHVVITGKTIRIDNILEHKGTVNYEIGNINFDGTVIIHGTVEEGFVVRATGDVFVEAIARGFVESGGNIVVEKGIIGTPDTYVRAAGDITAKFVENANLFAEGNILVSEAILHSSLSARHNIVLREGKRSVVVGGVARAGGSVEARTIGSDVATKTVVEVGYDPTVRGRIGEIEKEVDLNRKNFESVKQGIETLNKLKEKYGALPVEKEELLKKLVSTARGIAEKIRQLQRELLDLNRRLSEAKPGVICARDRVLAGAVLTIMNYTMQIDKPYSFVRFYFDQQSDDIKFTEFKEVDI